MQVRGLIADCRLSDSGLAITNLILIVPVAIASRTYGPFLFRHIISCRHASLPPPRDSLVVINPPGVLEVTIAAGLGMGLKSFAAWISSTWTRASSAVARHDRSLLVGRCQSVGHDVGLAWLVAYLYRESRDDLLRHVHFPAGISLYH
jgi:hypothetical protein